MRSQCNGCDADIYRDYRSSRSLVERSDTTSVHRAFARSGGRFGRRNSEQVVAPVVSLSGMKVLTPFAASIARMSVVGVLPNFQGFGSRSVSILLAAPPSGTTARICRNLAAVSHEPPATSWKLVATKPQPQGTRHVSDVVDRVVARPLYRLCEFFPSSLGSPEPSIPTQARLWRAKRRRRTARRPHVALRLGNPHQRHAQRHGQRSGQLFQWTRSRTTHAAKECDGYAGEIRAPSWKFVRS